LLVLLLWSPSAEGALKKQNPPSFRVPILLYHRFGPAAADGMTVSTSVFEAHLRYLDEKGYKDIPLRQLVNYYLKKGPPPPPRSYVAAFTIKRRHAGISDNVMALPRYIMTDSSRGKVFERLLNDE